MIFFRGLVDACFEHVIEINNGNGFEFFHLLFIETTQGCCSEGKKEQQT